MTTATAVGDVEMRIAKVVGLGAADDQPFHHYVVLEEVSGDRQRAIAIGQPEAFSLAARLGGITWPRWSRHRSSPPPRCCKRRRLDAQVTPPKQHACVGR